MHTILNTDQIISTCKELCREISPSGDLHKPCFIGNEKKYLSECINSTMVSGGKYIEKFANQLSEYTGAKYVLPVVNGTIALYLALRSIGVGAGDYVITTPLSFIATSNAILMTGAEPIYIDVDEKTMGLCPEKYKLFLEQKLIINGEKVLFKNDRKKIKAVVPVHVLGIPARIKEIKEISDEYGISVIEDSAEALGSFTENKHCGTFGDAGILSFNGNKIITTGGGGAIITDNQSIYESCKHYINQCKVVNDNYPQWEFYHDNKGSNYRLPNINASLGCAQMELFDIILKDKIKKYYKYLISDLPVIKAPEHPEEWNYWLTAISVPFESQKEIIKSLVEDGIQCRPLWMPSNILPRFAYYHSELTPVSRKLWKTIVCLPSGATLKNVVMSDPDIPNRNIKSPEIKEFTELG